MPNNIKTSYLDEIIRALKSLGGIGSLKEINDIIEKSDTMPYIHTNINWQQNVSAVIQRHCKMTRSYRGAEDLFYSVYGLGEGYWGLNELKHTVSEAKINPIEERQISEINNNTGLTSTEKEAIILARRGQGEFRKKLIDKYKMCIVTGISDPRLLTASHIKPWRSADNHERLSSENGLLLSPLYDKLFDSGLITFRLNGTIAVSSDLPKKDKTIINIDETRNYITDITDELKKNIQYHNDVIFIA